METQLLASQYSQAVPHHRPAGQAVKIVCNAMQGTSPSDSIHISNVVTKGGRRGRESGAECQLPKVFMQYSTTSCLASL